jgi:hypothetical protein
LGRSFTPYDNNSAAALATMGGLEDDIDDAIAAARNEAAPQEAAPTPVDGGQDTGNQTTPYNFDNIMVQINMIANLSLVDTSDQCIPQLIDSLEGIKIVGASAGHRHTLLLDSRGWLYSCGAGITGCLGHGDNASQMFPVRINAFGKFMKAGAE